MKSMHIAASCELVTRLSTHRRVVALDSTDFTDVAAGDLLGILPAALEASTVYSQGYKGTKRYIRAVITKTSGTSIAAGAVFALGHPHDAPIA